MSRGPLIGCALAWASLLFAAGAGATPADDARAAEAKGDRAAAIAAWRRAVEADPGDGAAYEALGRLQLRAKDYAAAVTTFERLVARLPDHPRARYRLAFALRKARRYPAAVEQYRAYIVTRPEDPDARFGLAETLKQLGDRPGALEAYRAYVRLERRPSEAKWVARARAEIEELERSEVVAPGVERPLEPAAPEAAKAEAPASPATASDDPDADFRAGRYAQARAGYLAQREAMPDAPALRYKVAVSAALLGDVAQAEGQAAHTARLDPGNQAALDLASATLARQLRDAETAPPTVAEVQAALGEGRVRTAEQLAAAALADDATPAATRPQLHRARGRALLVLDRVEEALGALKAAAGLGQADPGLWLDMAEAVRRAGDRQAARRLYQVVLGVAPPGHPVAERARAALSALGRAPGNR